MFTQSDLNHVVGLLFHGSTLEIEEAIEEYVETAFCYFEVGFTDSGVSAMVCAMVLMSDT